MQIGKSVILAASFIAIIFLAVMTLPDSVFSMLPDELRKAFELFESGRLGGAEKIAMRLHKMDVSDPDILHLLARIQMRKGTIQDRSEAERMIREAIRLRPGDIQYHLTLAEIYKKQNFMENAQRYLEGLETRFPDEPEVLYQLGQIYQKNAERMQYLVSSPVVGLFDDNYYEQMRLHHQGVDIEKLVTDLKNRYTLEGKNRITTFEPQMRNEIQNAEKIYERLHEINPHYKNMDYQKALLAYHERDWESMITCARDYAGHNPKKRDSYLILGLAYLRSGDYGTADSIFAVFSSMLSPYEKTYYEYFDGFLGKREREVISYIDEKAKAEYHRKFWLSKDPLFMTDYNERKLEHYGRIAEASLLFGNPDHETEGWKSDRGIIWIRYGPPQSQKLNSNLDFAEGSLRERLSVRNPYNSEDVTLFWYYDDFTFMFYEFPTGSGNFRFFEDGDYSNRLFAEKLQKEKPDQFKLNISGERYSFPRYLVGFRGKKGLNRVELFYGIPMRALKYRKSGSRYLADAERGVFLFDMNLHQVIRDVKTIHQDSPWPADSLSDNFVSLMDRLEVRPGLYNLAIEFMDDSSGNYGAERDQIYLQPYGYDSLQVSDILLASNITVPENGKVNSIDELNYAVNVARTYRKPSPVYLYFEIYNLALTGAPGRSRFQIEYGIEYNKQDSGSDWAVRRFLGSLFRLSEKNAEIAAEDTYEGSKPVETIYLRVETDSLDPGLYQLEVKVTDMMSGQAAKKKTEFAVK